MTCGSCGVGCSRSDELSSRTDAVVELEEVVSVSESVVAAVDWVERTIDSMGLERERKEDDIAMEMARVDYCRCRSDRDHRAI